MCRTAQDSRVKRSPSGLSFGDLRYSPLPGHGMSPGEAGQCGIEAVRSLWKPSSRKFMAFSPMTGICTLLWENQTHGKHRLLNQKQVGKSFKWKTFYSLQTKSPFDSFVTGQGSSPYCFPEPYYRGSSSLRVFFKADSSESKKFYILYSYNDDVTNIFINLQRLFF